MSARLDIYLDLLGHSTPCTCYFIDACVEHDLFGVQGRDASRERVDCLNPRVLIMARHGDGVVSAVENCQLSPRGSELSAHLQEALRESGRTLEVAFTERPDSILHGFDPPGLLISYPAHSADAQQQLFTAVVRAVAKYLKKGE